MSLALVGESDSPRGTPSFSSFGTWGEHCGGFKHNTLILAWPREELGTFMFRSWQREQYKKELLQCLFFYLPFAILAPTFYF